MFEGVEDSRETFVGVQFLDELLVDLVASFPCDLSRALAKVPDHVVEIVCPHAEVLE